MEGIAKTAPQTTEPIKVEIPQPAQPPVSFEGMPLELIRYFDIDVRKIDDRMKKQVGEIYGLCHEEGMSIGDVMLRVREIENRLGQPSMMETRYGKVWSWLKVNNNIKEMEKQRKSLEVAR